MNQMPFSVLAFGALTAVLGGPCSADPFQGRVLTADGQPIEAAIILLSDGGSATTQTPRDGTFEVARHSGFLVVQHLKFSPKLVSLAEHESFVEIRLEPAGDSVRRLRRCSDSTAPGSVLLGGALRIPSLGRDYRGPTYGEHDSHWFIDFSGAQQLHIATGTFWHSGLPLERWLAESRDVEVRGWTSNDDHGLDLAGHTPSGKRWRWLAWIINDAISYHDADEAGAKFFDSIVETACIGGP